MALLVVLLPAREFRCMVWKDDVLAFGDSAVSVVLGVRIHSGDNCRAALVCGISHARNVGRRA
jgi:hypothetical protein